MRVPTLFLLFFLAVLAAPSDGRAEKVKTNQPTKLLNRPGERGTVIMTIKEGQGMTVLAKEGRWLKVRVAGRTGFVPRSKVDISDEIARNTRRRSFVDGRGTKRGFNGEEGPEDRVGADAVGQPARGGDPDEDEGPKGGAKGGSKGGAKGGSKGGDPDEGEDEGEGEEEPDEGEGPKGGSKGGAKGGSKGGAKGGAKGGSKGEDEGDSVVVDEDERPTARVKAKIVALQDPEEDAEESFAATPSTVLYPTGTKKGKYTEVENDEGELGYVLTSQLEMKGGGGGGGVSRGGVAGEGGRARQIDLRARLGVSILSQKLRTAGAPVQVPDNYDLSTSAATISLGGALLYPYKAKFVVGGELSYDFAKAIPGIKVMGGTTGVTLHNLKLRALGGYDLKKRNGLTLFGRLGLHYQSYQISDVTNLMKNTAKLPSEIVAAPSLGAGVSIPRLTQKIGLQFSLDGVFLASVSQTKNLEDGGSPSAVGAVIGAGMRYHWKKDMDIAVTYDLTIMSMSYGTPVASSQRMHTGMGAVTRGDTFHAVTAGVSKTF